MIWLILIGSMLLGIMVIRFTYLLEKRKHLKDRKNAEASMKEFMDMLQQKKKEDEN